LLQQFEDRTDQTPIDEALFHAAFWRNNAETGSSGFRANSYSNTQ